MADNTQDTSLIGDEGNAIDVNDPAGLNALSGTPSAPPVPDSSNLPVVSNQGPSDPTAATVAQNNANGTDAAGESDMNDATSGAADGAQGGSGSMWQRILQGALAGLAGQQQHGRSSFANGAIGGAKGAEVAQQQQKENDIQQTAAQDAHQLAQSHLAVAHLQQLDIARQYALAPKSHQDEIDNADETVGTNLRNNGTPVVFTSQSKDAAGRAEAQQAATSAMQSDPQNASSYIPHRNTDGTYSLFHIDNPSAKNTAETSVVTAYNPPVKNDGTLDWDAAPVASPVTVQPGGMTMAAITAAPTAAMANYQQRKAQAQAATAAQQTPEAKQKAALTQSEIDRNESDAKKNNADNKTPATPDAFGVTSSLDPKQYNSRYNTFSKAYVQPLTKTDQQLAQFANIQSDFDKTGNLTGAESVVGLFNAIGISASPLKGMGFRINNNTVEEHANARGLGQSLYQKLLSLKSGDVVTPQQLKDYASIATQARESQYNSAIDEARRQQLPVDFLPKGNGSQIDPSTARLYLRAANGDPAKARAAANASGWKMGQ